jgi:hypothetical protein
MLNYNVSFWSNTGNDCWYSEDFATRDEALAMFHAVCHDREVAHIEIDGPDIHIGRVNPNFRPMPNDGEWRREIATQAGMEGGCGDYNEIMGWD